MLQDKEFLRAYEFAKKAHSGQKRYSGEDYSTHPYAVAEILSALNPDMETLQAAVLHDIPENTAVTIEEIEKEFGGVVAGLVDGVSKLSLVKVQKGDDDETAAERWRRMFIALSKDIRIVFIKLADRIHNMRTLLAVPQEKQERIARETLLVYAGVASRLGIYAFKSELEDLAFKHLYPEEFLSLSSELSKYKKKGEKCMFYAISQVKRLLEKEGVEAVEVKGRMKHLFSIFQKMEKKDKRDLESIYDLFAVRVVLPDKFKDGEEQIAHVYATLGLLHNKFEPLSDRFKDYIAVPKLNGYRSLHTTVLGLGGEIYDEPTEVQIRTLSMHNDAELGLASHWSYKLGRKKGLLPVAEQIFVLTPKGKVIELPKGANPIDFAYSVHTEIGNKMIGAKVNGKSVPIDYELQNGETVEIVTRGNGRPSRYWISIVKTASARNKLHAYFRGIEEEEVAEEVHEKPVVPQKKVTKKIDSKEKTVLVSGERNLPIILSSCCKPTAPCPIVAYVSRGKFLRIHRLSCRSLDDLDGDRFISAKWG